MNAGEYGGTLAFNVNRDVQGLDSVLYLRSPKGKVSAPLPVTVGNTDYLSKDLGKFKANEYVEYVIQQGDIEYSGWWEAKVDTEFSDTKLLKTDWQRFWVAE